MSWVVSQYKKHFLWVEVLLGFAAGIGFYVWAGWFGGMAHIDPYLKENRSAVYGALASIFGALLGFVITAVSILLGFASSEKLTVVRNSQHYGTLWDVFTVATKMLGLATVAAFASLVLDRDEQPCHIVFYVCVTFTIVTVLCLMRCLWVLEKVIKIVTAPPKRKPKIMVRRRRNQAGAGT